MGPVGVKSQMMAHLSMAILVITYRCNMKLRIGYLKRHNLNQLLVFKTGDVSRISAYSQSYILIVPVAVQLLLKIL